MSVSGERGSDPDTRTGTRVEGFDLARALAFLGMVFVNFRIAIATDGAGPQWLNWLDTRLDGRAAATFVTLAGVGVSLMSRKARDSGSEDEPGRVRGVVRKRATFLFVAGLLYWPIWPADILHYYGVFLAIAAFLIAVPDRRLLAIAVALVVAFPLLLIFGPEYSLGWDWEKLVYLDFWTPRGFVRNLLYNGFHPVIPWLAFLLLGMWLGRKNWTDRAMCKRLLVLGLLGAVGVETLSLFLVKVASPPLTPEDALAVFGTRPMPPMPLYMIAAAGSAVTVIVLSVLVARRHAGAAWLKPLVSTGQLALTLYVGHVVVGLAPLAVVDKLEGRGTVAFSMAWAGGFCLCAILFAYAWRKRFRRGPLEWLMRRICGE